MTCIWHLEVKLGMLSSKCQSSSASEISVCSLSCLFSLSLCAALSNKQILKICQRVIVLRVGINTETPLVTFLQFIFPLCFCGLFFFPQLQQVTSLDKDLLSIPVRQSSKPKCICWFCWQKEGQATWHEMLLQVQKSSYINVYKYIYSGALVVFVVFFYLSPKFCKLFSLNSNSNEKHLFVARSELLHWMPAWNSLSWGSDELRAQMGRWVQGGSRVDTHWQANRAGMKCAVWGGSATHANNPSYSVFSCTKATLETFMLQQLCHRVSTPRRWYEELKPDLDLGLLQGNSARGSPGHGAAWGWDCFAHSAANLSSFRGSDNQTRVFPFQGQWLEYSLHGSVQWCIV